MQITKGAWRTPSDTILDPSWLPAAETFEARPNRLVVAWPNTGPKVFSSFYFSLAHRLERPKRPKRKVAIYKEKAEWESRSASGCPTMVRGRALGTMPCGWRATRPERAAKVKGKRGH